MTITQWNLSGAILLVIVAIFLDTEGTAQERIALRPAKVGTSAIASFSPNADSAALATWTSGTPYNIQLWDLAKRTTRHVLRGHTDRVSSLAFAPDGRTLASGAEDHAVCLWDVSSGKQLRALKGHTKAVTAVAFSPDGKTLVSTGDDKTFRVWSFAEGKLVADLRAHNGPLPFFAFAPNGETLATACLNEDIRLWDTETWKPQDTIPRPGDGSSGHKWTLQCMTFSPDGTSLAMGGYGYVRVIDLSGKREQATLALDTPSLDKPQSWLEGAVDLQFSADGRRLVIGAGRQTVKPFGHDEHAGNVLLWNWTTDKAPTVLQGRKHAVICVSLSRNGKKLRSASADGTIMIWNLGTPDPMSLRGHQTEVYTLAFSSDGKTLVSGSDGGEGSLRVWDVKTRELERKLDIDGRIRDVSISPDGKTLAVAEQNPYPTVVKLWDLESARVRTVLNVRSEVYGTAFSPDNRFVATVGLRGNVDVWDATNSGRLRVQLKGHAERLVHSVAFSPDGKTLASADTSGLVKLWDLATGLVDGEFMCGKGHSFQALAFSPDGKILATGSVKMGVALWDARSSKELDTKFEISGDVTSVAFSPDGDSLAVGTNNGHVSLFDPATARRQIIFSGDSDAVNDLAFSPDGKLLASARRYECAVKLWDLEAGLKE